MPKNSKICVRINTERYNKLKELAEKSEMSVSEYIRTILKDATEIKIIIKRRTNV